MKESKSRIALVLSGIAIILSLYSVYESVGYKLFFDENIRETVVSDDFKKDVYTVIDAYIADKNAEANKPPARSEALDISLDDDAIEGEETAPVTLLEFSDYECPFCGKFFTDTLPKIEENYIDTGRVKHVFRDFPLEFHPDAIPAANAAECVREQGGDAAYWAYHDILFQNQKALSVDDLKTHASGLDIDQVKFATCVDNLTFASEIAEDTSEGRKYGVGGTPGFLILGKMDKTKIEALKDMEIFRQGQYIIEYIETKDGEQMGMKVSGAQSYATFQGIIDKLLE